MKMIVVASMQAAAARLVLPVLALVLLVLPQVTASAHSTLGADLVSRVRQREAKMAAMQKQAEAIGASGGICLPSERDFAPEHLMVSSCSDSFQSQLFTFNNSAITSFEDPALCLTVGTDDDPFSGTPSIDLAKCAQHNTSQIFSYNVSTNQIVHTATGHCIDLDGTDSRLELYECNDPVSPNQQWLLVPSQLAVGALNIVSVESNTSCVTACTSLTPGSVGHIAHVMQAENSLFVSTNTSATINVTFYAKDVFRVMVGSVLPFEDLMGDDIVLSTDFDSAVDAQSGGGPDTYYISSGIVTVSIQSNPLLISAKLDATGATLWEEREPIRWNTSTITQSFVRGNSEHFYGCGMQNGYFSHRGAEVQIKEGGGWASGGRPNPVPFYMSTAGYGTLRNTYAPGQYNFLENATYNHNESQIDAFYFVGNLPRILDLYTQATGRPFMPPIWGLQLGDSDCYNQKNRTTTDVIAVAKNYSLFDMPGGWLVPNDGYGCGYTELPYVIDQLHDLGKYTALWTSTGLANATWEIGTAGSRGIKTDVGWVGAGYKFGLDAVKLATSLIEGNTNQRRYIWTVCGWAGTHAYAIMWNGDNGGKWSYIQFQIPTVLGSGLSAQAHTSGDVDGIFAGSAETYVRDLQWKCFLTVSMTMSGWAKYNKQPWTHGEPYTSFNRKYLKLKMRLLPYHYTYSHIAHRTGLPPARALVLEYPSDPVGWDNSTAYQFFSGEWFLVAPVFEKGTTRDGIYLPADDFVDYWNGTLYHGPATLNNYIAPLDVLPLFVKTGAIIPMWPAMNYFFEKPRDPLTLDIYPSQSREQVSSFTLYEDDGLSREFEKGAYSLQNFTMTSSAASVTLEIGAVQGSYANMNITRFYEVTAHVHTVSSVTNDGKPLQSYPTLSELDAAVQGYSFNPDDRFGVATVKLLPRDYRISTTVVITR